MSIVENLNRIKSCKEDIKQAIADKGVDMTNVAFTEYATKISEIQAGGGSGDYLDMRANLSTYYSTAESVADYAFAFCNSLQSVNLPMCMKINAGTFTNCKSLQSVNLPMCERIEYNGFTNCSSLQSINLPNCSHIGGYGFQYCSSLQLLNLPKLKTFSGQNIFADCKSLQSIYSPMIERLAYYAFYGCYNLQSINLPNCSYVDGYAFQYCSSLSNVNVPVCSGIGDAVFTSCSSLTVFDLRSTYSCVLAASNVFSKTPFASGIGSIYVHNTVLSQFQNATNWTYFSKCLVGVGDPTRPLLSFDSGRVYGDTPLLYKNWKSYLGITSSSVISIDLTNCVSVGNSTFQYCSSLQTVNLPMCEYVGSFAFGYCSSLQSIDLPICEYVATDAFTSCSSLQTVNLPMCSYVDEFAFQSCSSLQTVNLPICEYVAEYGFNYCKSLTTINLPMCSYLGRFAFQGVYSISTIYLGTSLSTVCEVGQNPITIGMGTVPDIYVPTSLVSAYKTHPYWSYFASKIFGI